MTSRAAGQDRATEANQIWRMRKATYTQSSTEGDRGRASQLPQYLAIQYVVPALPRSISQVPSRREADHTEFILYWA